METVEVIKFDLWLEDQLAKARQRPGVLHKVMPEWYLTEVHGEMVEITFERDEDTGTPLGWIARDYNQRWYGNTYPTLNEAFDGLKKGRGGKHV